MSSENTTPPRAKKPANSASSLAGVRVASDEEIRAAAQAEISRIRAEIAQQKQAAETGAEEPKQSQTSATPEAPRRRTPLKPGSDQPPVRESTSTNKVSVPTTPAAPKTPSDNKKPKQPEPQKKTITTKRSSAEGQPRGITLRERIFRNNAAKTPADNFNIKRWEPTAEEAAALRTQKIRRLRVLVAVTATVFIGLLGIIIYLSTGGLVHPTQGVTTEWGTATQVNTLVDKFSTPSAGNHVIVHLPGEARAESIVLGFLQGFDGTDYLVTIGAETVTVPQEDFVGTVTAIWPSLF